MLGSHQHLLNGFLAVGGQRVIHWPPPAVIMRRQVGPHFVSLVAGIWRMAVIHGGREASPNQRHDADSLVGIICRHTKPSTKLVENRSGGADRYNPGPKLTLPRYVY